MILKNVFINRKPLIIYLGLFLFLSGFRPHSPSKEIRERISAQIDSIVQQFYFSNPDTAIVLLNGIAHEAAERGLWDQLLYISINQASIASDIEDNDSFRNYLSRGDSLIKKHLEYIKIYDEDGYIRANQHFLYGRYFYDQFNFEGAIEEYSKVFSASSQDSLLFYDTYLSIGQAYYNLGNYEGAFHAYNLAKISLPKIHDAYAAGRDNIYRQAFINSLIGRALFFKGETAGKKSFVEDAIKKYYTSLNLLNAKENDKSSQRLFSTLYGRIATAQSYLLNHDSAFIYVEKMFSKISESPVDQIQSYLLAGEIYLNASDSEGAMDYYSKAFSVAKTAVKENNTYMGQVLTGIGKVYALKKDFQKAIRNYKKAIPCFTDNSWEYDGKALPPLAAIKNENEMLVLLEAMANSYFSEFQKNGSSLNHCLSIYKHASALADLLKREFQSAESRQLLASRTTSIYEGGLAAAYEAFKKHSSDVEYQNAVLYFIEKNKAAQLLEASNEGFAQTFSGIPRAWLEREKVLKGKIGYIKRIINEATKDNAALRVNLNEAYEDYNSFTQELKLKFPEYYTIRYKTEIISLKKLWEMIPEKTLFVEYFFGTDALYILSATNKDLNLEKVEDVEKIKRNLQTVLKGIKDPTSTNLADESFSLSKLILKPILDKSEGIQQLWIVADGPLGYLPFEALVQKETGKGKPLYLLQDYNIKYEFSGSLLKPSLTPSKGSNENYYLGFAPDYDYTGSISEKRFELTPLRFNKQEIEAANQYFDGISFLNKTATEEKFYQNADSADILHLSMHAVADDINPLYSAFYFGNSEIASESDHTQVNENDGVLHLYELYNYPLKASLAVLSACETGAGSFANGEGIMSLGRAFQYAGCPSVVMSLWQVNDKSTANIMSDFFRNLSQSLPKDEALRKAKLSFLNNPKNKFFSHPYYWSGFILVGDSRPLDQDDFLSTNAILLSLFIFLLFAIICGVLKRRFDLIHLKKQQKNEGSFY